MKISIITINYNNKEGLLNTIKSIQKQTSNIYEYIVVDGNSIDGSVGVIKKYNDLKSKSSKTNKKNLRGIKFILFTDYKT